ncbi:hypothetical protein GO003_017885 [Methylicorpusculum oleiharenae]|uniref:hypothetical protein n=1 Tax=Methylicorpusculum oleiharenae TaxID=1338687 RepID=UPI001356E883|nr:hypothetical protein [Methylicorpusculum oleiharenae]MCD2449301.1 hypothetical protein [Methylicorpusculum oleiharenae]MCD2452263.1 hypothetical protein [Methylicorpusculum oleiharenae]
MKLDENLKRREIRPKEREKQQRLFSAWRNRQKDELELMATHKLLPEFLCIDDIATLSGHYTGALESIIRLSGVEFEEQEIQEGHGLLKGFTRQKYKEFLQSSGQWPPNGLLFNWWSLEKPDVLPKITTKSKREHQLHSLIWRVWQSLNKDGHANVNRVWNELQKNYEKYDTEEIIQEVTAQEILWISTYGTERRNKKTGLNSVISRLKRNPPI